MRTSRGLRRFLVALSGLGLFAGGMATAASLGSAGADAGLAPARLPGFGEVVSLSHTNDPAKTPLFPGDPRFRIETVFTVNDDGFFLEVVHEGMHTGTHYSAPCHFREDALCMDDLSPADLVLPAVVVDIRKEVAADPDHVVTVADLRAWEDEFGPMPEEAAVLLWTGCSRFWAQLLQLRNGSIRGSPAGLLPQRGEVADRDRCARQTRRARHRHVRPGPVLGRGVHADLPDPGSSPRHDREPDPPRLAPDDRCVDRARQPAERERLGSPGDRVRVHPVAVEPA
jgi:putative cyclase